MFFLYVWYAGQNLWELSIFIKVIVVCGNFVYFNVD
jgi:hypothetical protein